MMAFKLRVLLRRSKACQASPRPLPVLPPRVQPPPDLPAAIRSVKSAIRARIEASGRTVEEVFAVVEREIRTEVQAIASARARGDEIWPVIDYADIAGGTVTPGALALLRRRGCLVVRGQFPCEQARATD